MTRQTTNHSQPKVLLFDIDGTLILSGGAGRQALDQACLELLGIEDAMAHVKPGGMTDPAIVRQIYLRRLGRPPTQEDLETVLARYLECLPAALHASAKFQIMPGIPQLLGMLHERPDVLMGLGTGNHEQGARLKLDYAGLFSYFQFGGFGSDAEDRSELLRRGIERGVALSERPVPPENIFVIGDTVLDVLSGRKAGARTIAVATGMTERSELEASSPDHLFEDFADPRSLLALI